MITLNNINLSSIDLSGIDLRGIKLGLGGRGSGSGDGFPQLPGDVTRWHFGGLTNEMMAAMDDPRIEDADHKGRFLSFKNFAWGGMSGVGGVSTYYDKYEFTPDKYYMVAVSSGTQHAQFTFKVTGLVDGNTLSLADASSPSNLYGKWTQDGIYTVDIDVINTDKSIYFYNGVSAIRGTFTIEILPLYPGALVFDGVDDYGTCDNFPILTKEKGYTVVALRQWIDNSNNNAYLLSNAINNTTLGAFVFERNKNSRTYSFGSTTVVSVNYNPITYQTLNRYNSIKITAGTILEGNDVLLVGANYKTGANLYANAAIWELVFLDHDATEEELTKIKDYFVKTYPWLFPDQAWTVVGKTKEDEDRATIANITGNGNDLVLSNFGFAEGSGYNEEGEYAGYLVTDGVDDKVVSAESIAFTDTWTIITDAIFLGEKVVSAGILVKDIFGVSNLMEYGRVEVSVKGGVLLKVPTPSIKAICSDGRIYDADWNEYQAEPGTIKVSEGTLIIGMWYNGIQFCSIAFKNLGIYNNQLLSKDDCIKSYNYLQTLKAK